MKKIPKVVYTLEFKLEAVRRVRRGEPLPRVAQELGIAPQTLRNWKKWEASGKLGGVEGGKPITPEQMEISRLRAENARLRMERGAVAVNCLFC